MIVGANNVSEMLSIFHDGFIEKYQLEASGLRLDITIRYLTQRIKLHFTKFSVLLGDADNFSFVTWPNNVETTPRILREPKQIFAGELDMLSSEVKNGIIELVLNQSSTALDYCGGTLSFTASSAIVTDEDDVEYSLDQLGKICDTYWTEWSSKIPKS